MIHPLRMHYDKLLLALAIAALGCSLDWVRRQQPGVRLLRAAGVSPDLPPANFQPAPRKQPIASGPVWTKSPAQPRGDGWTYEVFTPPAIHYNPTTRDFVLVQPMEAAAEEADLKSSPDVRPVQKPEVFPLQLVGYFGSPDDYLVVFQSLQTADTLLVRAGHRFADLGLTFKSFEVRKVLVTETESGPVYEVAAMATLLDERRNREVVLDSRTRGSSDTSTAQTALSPEPLPHDEAKRVATNSQ